MADLAAKKAAPKSETPAAPAFDGRSDQELSPEELKQKYAHLDNRPKVPTLSKDEAKQAIAAYRQLSRDRQLILKQLMKYSCGMCESEFKVPNVGASHGYCPRHLADMYQKMGRPAPKLNADSNKRPVDLSVLSKEEIALAVKLFGILRAKDKGRLARRTDIPPMKAAA
jgi:hypothetical protein